MCRMEVVEYNAAETGWNDNFILVDNNTVQYRAQIGIDGMLRESLEYQLTTG